MPNRWMEEEIRRAQQAVPESEVDRRSGPFPVYRPSKKEIVWVSNIDDVVFVALAEEFSTKLHTMLSEDEKFSRLSLVRRIFYRGRKNT